MDAAAPTIAEPVPAGPMDAASARAVPLNALPVGDPAMGDPAMGDPAMGDPAADREAFCSAMAQVAGAASVITASGPDGPIGCTVNSLISLSADPPTVLVSLAATSRTLAHAVQAGAFGVNVLSWPQRDLCRRFATGDPATRFAGLPHTLAHGVPLLPDSAATLPCRLLRTIPLADHTLLLGTPLSTHLTPTATAFVLYQRHPHPVPPPAA
jgi:flavin reductase (DIM6/NTAB) family NADH-FMN oxidoreductase RutF